MKLKKETVLELGEILKSEFRTKLAYKDLEKLAHSLVGYFDLLIKINFRHKFGNGPDGVIDSGKHKELDKDKEQ